MLLESQKQLTYLEHEVSIGKGGGGDLYFKTDVMIATFFYIF